MHDNQLPAMQSFDEHPWFAGKQTGKIVWKFTKAGEFEYALPDPRSPRSGNDRDDRRQVASFNTRPMLAGAIFMAHQILGLPTPSPRLFLFTHVMRFVLRAAAIVVTAGLGANLGIGVGI